MYGVAGALSTDANDKAVSLPGTAGNWVGLSGISTGISFSMECWVRRDVLTGTPMIWQYIAPAIYLYFSSSVWLETNLGGQALSAAVPADTGWHHVVLTWDHGTKELMMYVDGTLRGVRTQPSYPTVATGVVQFGAYGANHDQLMLDGALDEIAYYTTVLSPARVTAHYHAADLAPVLRGTGSVQTGTGNSRSRPRPGCRRVTCWSRSSTVAEGREPGALAGRGSARMFRI